METVMTVGDGNGHPQVQAAMENEKVRLAAKPDGTSEETKEGEIFIWHGGVRYLVGIPNKECYDACRAKYQARQVDPLEALADALERLEKREDMKPKVAEEMRRRLTDKAYASLLTPAEDRVVDDAELGNWVAHAEAGKDFMWFQLLKLGHPAMTEQLAKTIADAANRTGYLEVIEKVKAKIKKRNETAA